MDPKDAILAGEPILASVLAPHGFKFRVIRTGRGSGGQFVEAEFVRDDRRLEFHFRYDLGLVRYHIADVSASHGAYMNELGVRDQSQYPGFPKNPMESFHHLAHDLKFADDFLTGSGHRLISAGEKEAVENDELNAKLTAGYVGDTRTLEQLKTKFKQGHYREVIELSKSLKFPEQMKGSERRMLDIARTRANRRGMTAC